MFPFFELHSVTVVVQFLFWLKILNQFIFFSLSEILVMKLLKTGLQFSNLKQNLNDNIINHTVRNHFNFLLKFGALTTDQKKFQYGILI